MTKYFIALFALLIIAAGYFLFTTPAPTTESQLSVEHVEQQPQTPAPVQNDVGITVDSPVAMQQISGVAQITGQARGSWYFEGSFPIILLDGNSNEVAYGIATAEDEWMTEAYVPFAGEIDTTGLAAGTYFVMLKKDNPSGEPQNDGQTVFPIMVQ
jgi:hypothetical protein